MASTTDIRNGLVINLNGELVTIIEFQHIKTARGGAKIRTKLRNVRTGQVLDNTFRSGEKLDVVRLEAQEMQYLYKEGDHFIFMNSETYEQIPLGIEIFREASKFIKENAIVKILFDGSTPVDIDIPVFVTLEVTETEPGMKGDTVTGGSKQAIVETGSSVPVPLFIEVGDKIRVDTRSGKYCERVKE